MPVQYHNHPGLFVTITAHEGGVTDVTFSSDGVLLATASEDATAQLWHTASGKRVRTTLP